MQDAFSCYANSQPLSYHYGTRTPPILFNFVELAQVQKP